MKASVYLNKVRQEKPLVHHLTNWVTIYDCANIVKVFGASPVMAHAPEEVSDMSAIAGALVLNIGTLTSEFIDSMKLAAKSANKKGIPIVLDVCGAGNTIVFGNRDSLGYNNPIHHTLKKVCIDEDINFIEFPKFPMCDERPFYRAGIKSIMISLIPEYEAHIMWLRLNKPGGGKVRGGFGETEYLHSMHTINDTIELADPVGMTLCYKAVLATILRLDKIVIGN